MSISHTGFGTWDAVDVGFDGTWTETFTKEGSVGAGGKRLLILNPQCKSFLTRRCNGAFQCVDFFYAIYSLFLLKRKNTEC